MASLTESTIVSLLKRLSSVIKTFSKDIDDVATRHEQTAPTAEINEIIRNIRSKAPVAEKEKKEYEEIAKLLDQLLTDKKLLSYIKVETKDWLRLLEAIEQRMERHKGTLTEDEKELYQDIDAMTKKLRETMRKE